MKKNKERNATYDIEWDFDSNEKLDEYSQMKEKSTNRWKNKKKDKDKYNRYDDDWN